MADRVADHLPIVCCQNSTGKTSPQREITHRKTRFVIKTPDGETPNRCAAFETQILLLFGMISGEIRLEIDTHTLSLPFFSLKPLSQCRVDFWIPTRTLGARCTPYHLNNQI